MPLRYGKLPATYDKHDLLYADMRPKLAPAAPSVFGHGNDFTNWRMLANGPSESGDEIPTGWAVHEGCGDCAWAGPAHETMELNDDANRPIPRFTGKIIAEQYGEYCGYNLQTGEGDTGSNVREVLNWRRKKGLRDADGGVHKIGVYVALEPKSLQHIIEAAYLFECVGIGFEVPESAQQQFAEGRPWSVVHGTEIVGGHYIPIVGRPAAGYLAAVTWGRRQVLTEAFFETYVDEAWAYVTPEEINRATGKTYEHYTAAQLEEYLHEVTG